MADIFVSYTSKDREWAFWIGRELESLGHRPHIHEWEIQAGEDVAAWIENHLEQADRMLCVVSAAYLNHNYSGWERHCAEWAAASTRRNFMLPVFVEDCEPPMGIAQLKRCELFGVCEADARARLASYLDEARPPAGTVQFPGAVEPARKSARTPGSQVEGFPGANISLSNIRVGVPRYFFGRDDDFAMIKAAFRAEPGRPAVAALHGLRGVGKTTLAAAFAARGRSDYRATWWIRAQTPDAIRTDLVSLGARLGWIAADEKEEPALDKVRERLRDDGDGLLLIFDGAVDAATVKPFLPTDGRAHVLITSNSPVWRGVAEIVEIRLWPKQVGGNYLVVRTGDNNDREDAEALSEALGGLPLAHEQAAAYCERLGVSLAAYKGRFAAAPARLLDAAKDAPVDYYRGLTVSKAFTLAIDEAAKLHPAAEPLIVYSGLLEAEHIPLFFFRDARQNLGEPFASQLKGEGLDEAVAALRAFALVDRETVADERDPSIATDTIKLHPLVRTAAAGRRQGTEMAAARRILVEAMAQTYPRPVFSNPDDWPRARRLDALAISLVAAAPPKGAETSAISLLNSLGEYRHGALAAYSEAEALFQRALTTSEEMLGAQNLWTAMTLNNLALLLKKRGGFASARSHYERALAITENELGPEHPHVAASLNNLAELLREQGDVLEARPLFERALKIDEKIYGPDHIEVATDLDNLALLLQDQQDLEGALRLHQRAFEIREKGLGPLHPDTANSLNNLALLLRDQGKLATARSHCRRALTIYERALGPEHPETNRIRCNLARIRLTEGAVSEALSLADASRMALERSLGASHSSTRGAATVTADALCRLGRRAEAEEMRFKYAKVAKA